MNRTFFLLAIIALSAWACTTTKRRGEVSGLKKFYHDVTAKYNGYFNANEIMEATFAQLDNQHQDDFNKQLPLFPYLENKNPESYYPALDTAIKKVSVVVNLHRESQWTDDCYLLVGKARFLKQDYESAQNTFQYILNNFDPADMDKPQDKKATAQRDEKRPTAREAAKERKLTAKERKKERKQIQKERKKRIKQQKRERKRYNKAVKKARKKGTPPPKRPGREEREEQAPLPELNPEDEQKDEDKPTPEPPAPPEEDDPNYFLKHRPVFQEAKLWLAKTYIERDNLSAAQRLLTELIEAKNTFPDIRAEVEPVQAYLYLQQGEPQLAIPHLEQAVEMTSKNDGKARYAYVLAQLHQAAGRSDRAYATFDRVLKYTNDYNVEFNARLRMAQNAWLSGRGSNQDAIANLEKMLKDEKNLEYRDQIYYALASIALKSGDRQKGIENLELALQYGGQNQSQATETNYTLAQLYLEKEDFVPAKKYLDATLNSMNTNDSRYKEVKNLSENLTEIATNLEIIALQDSLLRISKMTDDEKREFAARLKKQRQEERDAAAANATTNTTAGNLPPPALQKQSEFFAYDDRGVKQGKRDFQRKWGNRALEDNWRRSNKQSFEGDEAGDGSATAAPVAAVSEEEAEDILAGIPSSEQEIAIANIKLRDALFILGKLYRDRLGNNEKAVASLEDLNRRYPENNFELDSWYYLYMAHTDLRNNAKAQEYANKILEKYPSTNYAKIIKDPNYIVEVRNEAQKLSDYYDNAYLDFQKGRYQQAFDKSVKARELFGARNTLQPKFALLTALSTGNLKGRDDYISSLNEVVSKYPNTEEQKYAREILRLLGASSGGRLPGNQQVEADQFEVNDDQVHSVIIALEDGSALNDSRNAVSDYNRKYHDSERLRISDVYLINGEVRTPLIVVRRFKNKDDAMRYYNAVQKNKADFIPSKYSYEVYAITQTNYGKLFASVKDVAVYKAFFDANYK